MGIEYLGNDTDSKI